VVVDLAGSPPGLCAIIGSASVLAATTAHFIHRTGDGAHGPGCSFILPMIIAVVLATVWHAPGCSFDLRCAIQRPRDQ